MDNGEARKIALEMGVHPYSLLVVIEALKKGEKIGKKKQKQVDHSAEHLDWIIDEYQTWLFRTSHQDTADNITFEEWIKKAMEEQT